MLQLEPGMLIWTWITFIVLVFVLYRVAWKPLVAMIEDREKAIEEGLTKAEKAKEEAESLLAEQQEKMAKTQEEVRAILADSKKLAESTRDEIVNEAKQEANNIIERGKKDIDRERQDAVTSMKKDISSLIVNAASKLISANLDEKKHRDLIEDSIKKLGKN